MLCANDLLITAFRSNAAFNLRGLDFSAQRWHKLDTTHIPALDLRGANMRGMYLTHCKLGKVICDEHTNASNAVFRECDTSQIGWNNAQRSGLIIRGKSVPRPAGTAPLIGPWTMPLIRNYILTLAFNPANDQLASAGLDGIVCLWDVLTKSSITGFKGHATTVNSIVFNIDGTLLASAGNDALVRLWDVQTKTQLEEFKRLDYDVPHCIIFNPDGSLLASAWGGYSVELWDIQNKCNLPELSSISGLVDRVAFNPTGDFLAATGTPGTVRLWNMQSKKEIAVLKGHTGDKISVAFSPSGNLLASAGNGLVRLWDVTTGVGLATLNGHDNGENCVTFNAKSNLLVSAGNDGSVRLWDVATRCNVADLQGHRGVVANVAFNTAGNLLASAGQDGTIRLWDMSTLEASIANKQPFKPAYQIIVPAPHAPYDPSWASFDGDGNLLDWSDSAVDHWLHVERNGRFAPIESVL